MNKLRTASVVVGAVAAVAVGGAAFAAGGSPSPSATDDRGGSVRLLPDGDVSPVPADDSSSPADVSSSPADVSSSPEDSAGGGTPVSSGPGSATVISLDRAKAIAVRAAGGGYVRKVEQETEHGRAVWDVDVIVGGVEHDIDVDRATGAVVRSRVKSSGGSAGRTSKPPVRATHDAGDDHGSAGHGTDDRAGDDRGGRGADDRAGDDRAGHGTDDRAGDDRGGRGADDPAGDDRGGRNGNGDDHGSGRRGSDD
jgi:hypothetical protein